MKMFLKRFILISMALSLLFLSSSCTRYVSSYKALMLERNQTSHSCEASFQSLEGQLVFKIKQSNAGSEGNIKYSMQVDKGEICLYYDSFGVKEKLASAKAGEYIDDVGGYVESGQTVYIIIESKEPSKAKISVELAH